MSRGRTRKESHWHDGQPSGYDWIGRSTRLAIYMRDGFKCLACEYRGGPVPFAWSGLSLDHLDTNNRGADPKNLVTLCLSCNSSRRATDPAVWNPVFAEAARAKAWASFSRFLRDRAASFSYLAGHVCFASASAALRSSGLRTAKYAA